MANRKKCPAANPERDRVKEIFRKNIQIAKKLQHEGYRDTLAMYDLSEKYCAVDWKNDQYAAVPLRRLR